MSGAQRLGVFHGGLQLAGHKGESTSSELAHAPLPARLILPLAQHMGLGSVPVVEAGQDVYKHQMIARADGDRSSALHAPTSGRIIGLQMHPVPHPSGLPAQCLVLESDGQDQARQYLLPLDPGSVRLEQLLVRVRDAGIVGLGGAVFPTASKIMGATRAHKLTLIINGAECEPYISCDDMLMRARPREIIRGARLLLDALGAETAIVAVERDKTQALEALDAALQSDGDERVRIERIFTIYPAGGERQLIEVLAGKEVPAGQLPIDIGFLCQNVATVAAIYRAVTLGEPLVSRITTISGSGVQQPGNFIARLGTPIAEVVQAAGGYTDDVARLIMGGPMMGISLPDDQAPLVKASNCVLALRAADVRAVGDEMPCIRCGDCERACPARLQPQELYWRIRGSDLPGADELEVNACIECGCCDFTCPSHIPLTQYFRFAKSQLRLAAAQKAKSDLARQRFEDRQKRLEKEKSRRKQRLKDKRQARGQEEQSGAALAEEIQAIVARTEGSKGRPEDPEKSS